LISPGCFLDFVARNVDTNGRNAILRQHTSPRVPGKEISPHHFLVSRIGEQAMRYLKKLIWAALIAAATSTPVLAQGASGAPGGMAGGAPGGTAGGTAGGTGGTSNTSTALSTIGGTPLINAPTNLGGNSGNTAVSTSNFFSPFFGNPYYQGILNNASNSSDPPGGFGATLFGTSGSGGTGGGQIGFAGTAGSTAGRGATGGRGGTSSTNSNNSGVVIPLPTQISYAAVPQFKINPVSAFQLQSEVIRMLRVSKEVSYPATVLVSTEGNTVTIRGNAKDRDEARTIEGMIRMTPGVRAVKNELSYPKQ
jgi:hypothetical protein